MLFDNIGNSLFLLSDFLDLPFCRFDFIALNKKPPQNNVKWLIFWRSEIKYVSYFKYLNCGFIFFSSIKSWSVPSSGICSQINLSYNKWCWMLDVPVLWIWGLSVKVSCLYQYENYIYLNLSTDWSVVGKMLKAVE